MEDFLATFSLIGQILSLVALSVGLVFSVLYWSLRDAVPQFVPEREEFVDEAIVRDRGADEAIAVARAAAPAMPMATLQIVQSGGEEGEEAKPPFMRFPPTQGPRPAAPI
jgi:hypothetical protein